MIETTSISEGYPESIEAAIMGMVTETGPTQREKNLPSLDR
jgi:hypothetical protein